MISLTAFIARYGALAIALGAGFEGEAAVITGGIIAHHGLVSPAVAALSAIAGSFAADQLFFGVARRYRESRWVGKIRATAAAQRALTWVETRPTLFCFAFRFIYGMRMAGPITVGTSSIPFRRFVILNLLSAMLWGTIFTTIGYQFGHAFEARVMQLLHSRYAWAIVATTVTLLVTGGFLLHRRRRNRGAPTP